MYSCAYPLQCFVYNSYMYSLISFSDDELRQARKHRFILLNMDFKWLALLSFVVHLWPKLNVNNLD